MSAATEAPRLSLTEDLGADRTGRRPSSEAFAVLGGLKGDVVVDVPPGIYHLGHSTHRVPPISTTGTTGETTARPRLTKGPSSLTLTATKGFGASINIDGEVIDRPRFVAPDSFDGVWLDFATPSVTLDGIDIIRSGTATGPQIRLRPSKAATVRDVRVLGRDDSDSATGALFDVRSGRRATVEFENVRVPHGAEWSLDTAISAALAGRPGIYAGPLHRGDLKIRNCVIDECSSYGVRAASARGSVTIRDSTFANSNRGQLRLGGPDDRVESSTITVDLSTIGETDTSGPFDVPGISTLPYTDLRGIRVCRDPERMIEDLRAGDEPDASDTSIESTRGVAGPTIDKVGVDMVDFADRTTDTDVMTRAGGIVGSETALGTTIDATDVRVDVDEVPAIAFDAPASAEQLVGHSDAVLDTSLHCRNVSARGSALSGPAVVAFSRSVTIAGCVERPGNRRPFNAELPADADITADLKKRCRIPPSRPPSLPR